MAFTITNPRIGFPVITDTDTTQKCPLGTIVTATDPTYGAGEFIYLLGVASTAVGSIVIYNADDFSTSLAVANDTGPVAVAMSANVASKYGWYQIQGKAVGKVLASFADNGDCYLTATAGSVDDADVAGDYVSNMKGASAIDTPSTGLAELEIARPFVRDGKDLSLIHISEPTRRVVISYAVFCLKKNFFNDTATTEIYTSLFVGSVRCV